MLAGGTGVTPMYQVAVAILKDPKDTTLLSLIFANVSEDDILIRQQLDALVQAYPTRFKVRRGTPGVRGVGHEGGGRARNMVSLWTPLANRQSRVHLQLWLSKST